MKRGPKLGTHHKEGAKPTGFAPNKAFQSAFIQKIGRLLNKTNKS